MTAPSPVQALPSPRFQLARMLGAGEDGAAYLGRDGGDRPVVVHRLTKLPFEVRRELERRLKKRQLVQGAHFLELLHVELDGAESSVVTERLEGSLAQL